MTCALLAVVISASSPDVQWLVFTAPWCGPCKRAEADYRPWLEKSGWKVGGRTCHLWLVNGDEHQDSVSAWKVESYPTFVLIKNGVEVKRHTAYPGRSVLAREYIEAFK